MAACIPRQRLVASLVCRLVAALVIALPALLTAEVSTAFADDTWSPAESIETFGPGSDASFNTPALDGCPFVSPDDRTFYLASNRAGGQGGIDIWVSTRQHPRDPWGAPINVGAPVNSSADDFCPTVSRDGDTFFFVSTRSGGCGGSDIYTARRHHTEFVDLRDLDCELNSPADEASPFPLAPSGAGPVLFFSSTRPGGFSEEAPGAVAGDSDLYVAASHAGAFRNPSLVPGVNSEANDGQPNVGRDGLEIFFFSTRPGGFGTADLYVATRDRTSATWSAPLNLGPDVNSAFAETRPSLSWDGTTLYFGSTRPGEGASDIYVTVREG